MGGRILDSFRSKIKDFAQNMRVSLSQIAMGAEMGKNASDMAGGAGMSGLDTAIEVVS